MTEPTASTDPHSLPPEPTRRGFLKKLLAVVVGTVVVAVPAAAALMVFLDPLRRKKGGAAAAEFVPITPLEALPADGSPRRFQVIADRADAWNKYRNVPLGAVYLKRAPGGSADAAGDGQGVVAFNALCPHAGCFVDVDADGRSFRCPCHNSGFNPDGSLKAGSVSPRPLDTLEVDPAALARGLVAVKFQNFAAGTPLKETA